MNAQISQFLLNYWRLHGTRGAGVFILALMHHRSSPVAVMDLARTLGMTHSCIIHHLRLFEKAKLVSSKSAHVRRSRLRLWSLESDAMTRLLTDTEH